MELHEIADHDLVSAAAAGAIGVDAASLRRLVRAGVIRRVVRGWYAVRAPGQERPPWEGTDDFDGARRINRLLTTALLKSFDGRVVASHQSALVLHGVPVWKADLGTAHLCRTSSDHTRHRPSAVIHPQVSEPPVRTHDGFQTVPLPYAIVQVGLYPPDQPVARSPMDSLIAADFALHHQLVTDTDLESAVKAHASHPGIGAVRLLLAHADARHESPGETRLGHSLRLLGYRFTPQVPLPGHLGYRGDFVLDHDPVVVEFDGLAKYSLGSATAAADTEQAVRENLAAEKRREEDVRLRGHHEFARFIWQEVDNLPLIRRRVDAAIARARLRRSA